MNNYKKIYENVIKKLSNMSPEEIFQTLVVAGIYDKHGNLTKHYTN